jgi:hypothetical protein
VRWAATLKIDPNGLNLVGFDGSTREEKMIVLLDFLSSVASSPRPQRPKKPNVEKFGDPSRLSVPVIAAFFRVNFGIYPWRFFGTIRGALAYLALEV